MSARTYWNAYTSPGNPFKPRGFLGNCQFPQITAEGLDDSLQHGKDLYGVYHNLLQYLPNSPSKNMSFRVTQNTITSQVAGMVVNGMFKTQNDIPLAIQVRFWNVFVLLLHMLNTVVGVGHRLPRASIYLQYRRRHV